jgi:hypothetical protein
VSYRLGTKKVYYGLVVDCRVRSFADNIERTLKEHPTAEKKRRCADDPPVENGTLRSDRERCSHVRMFAFVSSVIVCYLQIPHSVVFCTD